MIGYIHSFQSLGTVDGPGVRFVVFMQGCNLRCKCCHNPDTWGSGGSAYESKAVFDMVQRYRDYFGADGGITVSGGEPLLQSEFVKELFSLCKAAGINTCLDTSGSILNDSVKKLLALTDRVLLDIKYTNEEQYKENVGCSLSSVLEFLEFLDENRIPVTLRQVIIPSVNDSDDSILALKSIADSHKCIGKTELLPFRKLCQSKYDNMGIVFPFGSLPEPTKESMEHLNSLL